MDMQCPNCQSPLTEESYESVSIDRCTRCSGTWLDQSELTRILTTREADFSPTIREAAISGKPGISRAEIEKGVKCPKCSEALVPTNYSYSSGIIIDKCPRGDSLWLDALELEKIQAHHEHWNDEAKSRGSEWAAKAASAVNDSPAPGNSDQLSPFLRRLSRSSKR